MTCGRVDRRNYLRRDKFISKVKIELVKLTLADKNANMQADRQKDRQINRQKDRQTYNFTSHKWTEKQIFSQLIAPIERNGSTHIIPYETVPKRSNEQAFVLSTSEY